MEIQEIRKRIDEADEQLVQAFAKRMRAASDIADYKREHGLPVWDPAREREVMAKQTKAVDGDMAMYVKLLYNTIFDISRSYQQRRLHRGGELGNRIARAIAETPKTFPREAVVACQGVEGAYRKSPFPRQTSPCRCSCAPPSRKFCRMPSSTASMCC